MYDRVSRSKYTRDKENRKDGEVRLISGPEIEEVCTCISNQIDVFEFLLEEKRKGK